MTASEKSSFEQQLNSDVKLNKDFQSYKLLYKHIDDKIKFEPAFQALEIAKEKNETVANSNKSNSKSKLLWLALGLLAILLAYSIAYKLSVTKPSNQELYASYFSHELIIVQTKSSAEINKLESALELYNSQKYDESIKEFKTLNSNNSDGKLAFALSLMHVADTDNAKPILEELQSLPLYKNVAVWNLALIDVYENNIAAARRKLSNISDDSYYYKRAVVLKSKLK